METIIKNILDTLLSEEDKKKAIYTVTGLRTTEDEGELPYLQLVTENGFINKIASYLWNHNPRSKGTKPKVIYPIGQLNYEKFEDLVTDLSNFMKAAIEDEELEVWLKCILEKNIIPNSK